MNNHPDASLAAQLWPVAGASRTTALLRFATLSIAGALALTLSAKAQVPFYPVPLTLQTLVVLVLGAAFGARLAASATVLYLLEGAAGLPVFAGTPEKGLGLAYMMGPTGGFLAGFVFAAAFIGWCADRGLDRSAWKLTAVLFAGHAMIFVPGFAWLAKFIGVEKAWMAGIAPFYLATVVKTLLAAAIVTGSWKLIERLRG